LTHRWYASLIAESEGAVSSDKTLQGIVEGGSEEHEYGKEEQCVKAEQVDDAGRGVFNGRNTDALSIFLQQ
jgi:hypothetical protein